MKHDVYLRAILKDKNIKTIDLAEKMGISQPTLNRKIQGKIKFSDKDIAILTEILDMTYEEIFKPDKVDVKPKFEENKKGNKVYKVTITTHYSTKCDSTVTMSDGTKKKLSPSIAKKFLDLLRNDKDKDKEVI